MKSFRKLAVVGTLLAMLAAEAEASTAEIMVDNKGTTLDLKVGASVAPKVELFFRQIPTIKHDGEANYFGYGSLGYNVVDNLNALVQAQALTGVGSAYGVGGEYFNQFGDVNVYGLVDVAFWNGKPIAEFLLNLGYRPQLTNDLSLVLDVEAFTQLSERGHDFSLQKVRVGIGVDNFEFGPAINVTEAGQGKDTKVDYEIGGSVKVKF